MESFSNSPGVEELTQNLFPSCQNHDRIVQDVPIQEAEVPVETKWWDHGKPNDGFDEEEPIGEL